jgi:hypothetical protein
LLGAEADVADIEALEPLRSSRMTIVSPFIDGRLDTRRSTSADLPV